MDEEPDDNQAAVPDAETQETEQVGTPGDVEEAATEKQVPLADASGNEMPLQLPDVQASTHTQEEDDEELHVSLPSTADDPFLGAQPLMRNDDGMASMELNDAQLILQPDMAPDGPGLSEISRNQFLVDAPEFAIAPEDTLLEDGVIPDEAIEFSIGEP